MLGCLLWATPPDPAVRNFALGVPILVAADVVLLAWFAREAFGGRLALRRGAAYALLLFHASCAALLALVVASAGHGVPAWESAVARGMGLHGAAQAVAHALAWLGSFPFTLTALLLLFAWPAARRRWSEAYLALAAGPGLALAVVVAKLLLPRTAPFAQPFFSGPTAFPDDVAALAPAALAIHGLLRKRLGAPGVKVRWAWRIALGLAFAAAPAAAGIARPADAAAGLLLAGGWLSAVGMALLLLPGAAKAESPLQRMLGRLDRMAQRIFLRPGPWLVGLVALGAGLRILSYWWTPAGADSYAYAAMAHGFLRTGSFTMPWGDAHTYLTAPVASHHYPPLYPLYLAGAYRLLGFSQSTTDIASIASGLAALAVTYLCSRDLYGHRKGLVATAAAAASPLLIQVTGQDYSENLVLALFVATLWAILRSLGRPWFIVLAGLFAGLGYLTKSTMGPFFVVAGLGGLAWRLHWKGWKVLRDPAYLCAIACFAALASTWMLRNTLLFGSWETSAHIHDATVAALHDPLGWAYLALVTFAFYATAGYLLYLGMLAWLPSLARIPRLADEHDSGLWLALGLPLILTAAIDACLWLLEGQFYIFNVRYVAFVLVPAVWLLVRHADPNRRQVRLAALGTFALLVAACIFFAKPTAAPVQPLADDLGSRLAVGDSVGFVDRGNHDLYRYYFALTADGERNVTTAIACLDPSLCPKPGRPWGLETTWIVAPDYAAACIPQGYAQVRSGPWLGATQLWIRTGPVLHARPGACRVATAS